MERLRTAIMGQPTKYNQNKHIPLLVEVFSKGEHIQSFCAKAKIARATFFAWLKKYQKFKRTYEVMFNLAQSYWERLPLIDPTLNMTFWQSVMRYKYNWGKPYLVLEGKTHQERFKNIWNLLEHGTISTRDALNLARLILKQIKSEKATTLITEALAETLEQKKALYEKINKVLEMHKE